MNWLVIWQMLEQKEIVTNTSPLLALVAAWGTLEPLRGMYKRVWVPLEVAEEILYGGNKQFGRAEFLSATFLNVAGNRVKVSPFLSNSLDKGEAAVIQTALDKGIGTVCIDETVGRRIARLNELKLTGSAGVLVRYKQENPSFSLASAAQQMRAQGIRLSQTVIDFMLQHDCPSLSG